MSEPQRDDEIIDALENLGERPPARKPPAAKPSKPPPSPAARAELRSPPQRLPPKPPVETRPPAPEAGSADARPAGEDPRGVLPFDLAPVAPAAPPVASPPPARLPRARPMEAGEEPRFRCLQCGYPLAPGGAELRCPECGRQFESEELSYWFDGSEEARLDHLIWLVRAGLFVRLLLLPELHVPARLGMTVAAAWACFVAGRDKRSSVGWYYGVAGLGVAGFMFLFAWASPPLAFHTLDVMAAALLVLATLHGPTGAIGRVTSGRTLAPAMLVAGPLLGTACYVAWNLGVVGGADAFVWGGAVPYVVAAAAWGTAWWILAGLRRVLYRRSAEA